MTTARTVQLPYARMIGIIVLGLIFAQTGISQVIEKDLQKLLNIQTWSQEEISTLEKGDVVVRALDTHLKEEIAAIGVVKLRDLPAISMADFRQSLSQKGGGTKVAGGAFSAPPVMEDLNGIELEDGAIEQLQRCRIANCDFNLSADAIKRFERELDWTSPDVRANATRIMKEMILAQVREYLARGNTALGNYDNRRKSVDLAASHRSLLTSSTIVIALAPEFVEYLEQFPVAKLENVETGMQWSVVDFGLKPTIAVSHSTAYTQTNDGAKQSLFLAAKQIYSSRYLDCSLSFTMLLPTVTESETETYLIFIDRSRSDALEGPLGRFARDIVQKESFDRIKTLLEKAQLRLLVVGRTPIESEPPSTWLTVIRDRASIIGIGIVVLVILLVVVWRYRRRIT